jgi:hypothetical protein
MTNELPRLLRLNAAYSSLTGVVTLAGSPYLANALGVSTTLVAVLGAGLIGYSLGLAWLSRGNRATSRTGFAVAGADAAWVLMVALFLVVARPAPPGMAIAIATSVPVAVLAVLQARAAARLNVPGLRIVEVVQVVEGQRSEVWEVMIDPAVYASLAPNLSKVGAFSRQAESAQRRCWDVRGKHWDESLTTWQPGESFAVAVHTDADDYPYPLAQMRGSWSVADAGEGESRVTVRFEFQPQASMAGRAFAAALARSGPMIMRRIINGWQDETTRRAALVQREAVQDSGH